MGVEIKDMSNHKIVKKDKFDPKDPIHCKDPGCDHHEEKHHDPKEVCCVCKTVRYIDQLQKECDLNECCVNCESPKLGFNTPNTTRANTRPFSLLLPYDNGSGNYFRIRYNPIGETVTLTSYFRVEKVRGCCATLRALVPSGTTPGTLVATDVCITVDLCSFIGIQCWPDQYIAPC